jgi:hypothetical protein
MRITSIFVIAALLYSSSGLNGSIKKRLGEVNRNNLVEVECFNATNATCGLEILVPPTLGFCTCSAGSGAPPINGGSGQLSTFNQAALV